MTQQYTAQRVASEGIKCVFFSMGAERDGWIMPDGLGVSYAGSAQVSFRPESIFTHDPDGLRRSRCAVAQEQLKGHAVDFNSENCGQLIERGNTLMQLGHLKDGDGQALLFLIKFAPHSARFIQHIVVNLTDALSEDASWVPSYRSWRHGGWYVSNICYPSGAVGCVSNNYDDGLWRIVCDSRRVTLGQPGDFTFATREEAARAERERVRQEYLVIQDYVATHTACKGPRLQAPLAAIA